MLLKCWIIAVLAGICLAAPRQKRFYVCPPQFIRRGNSCYYLSTVMATWQDAHFACKDRNSELAEPKKSWIDKNLRSYLNSPQLAPLERWIGGRYDWGGMHWKWASSGENMAYKGFSREDPKIHNPEALKWHCAVMDPNLKYKWFPQSCILGKHYICEIPLKKVDKNGRNELKSKWVNGDPNQNLNEIVVPNRYNDDTVLPDPRNRPDGRTTDNTIPLNLSDNRDSSQSRRTNPNDVDYKRHKPNGYKHKKNRPNDGTFNRTAYALRPNGTEYTVRNGTESGEQSRRNGGRRRRPDGRRYRVRANQNDTNYLKNGGDRRNHPNDGYTEEQRDRIRKIRKEYRDKIRAQSRQHRLRQSENRRRARNGGSEPPARNRKRNKSAEKEQNLSIENLTQRTYVVDNGLSELHPKNIIEVHDYQKID